MAIVWSALSGGMYIGIEAWVKSGPDASGRVVIRADYFIEAQAGYAHAWTYPWHWSGTGGSGSANVTYNSTHSYQPRVQLPGWDVAVQAEYGRATWATFNASLGPIFNGGNPSVSVSVQVPARPYQPPAAPTQVAASRVSDTQVNLTWQTASTSTAPVLAQGVERKSAANPQWVRVATLHTPQGGAPALAWTDNTVSGNDEYTYRVWGDSGVQGKKTESNPVATTPTPPANVQAVKQADMSITVTWANTAPFVGAGWRVYDNGQLVAEVPAAQTTFTHAGASVDGAHTYTVRMLTGNGLASDLSAPSNTVVVLAPPNPPQAIRPQGFVDSNSVTFQWVHNPVDSTSQTAARVRYRWQGAANWSTKTLQTSDTYTRALPAGSYEWQVQTRGLHADMSEWSPVHVFDVVDAPGVAVTRPVDGDVIPSSTVGAEWTFYQAQGSKQASATVTLEEEDGGVWRMVERVDIQGATTTAAFTVSLRNATPYRVSVIATSGHGIKSEAAVSVFTVEFPAPPTPSLHAEWDESTGCALLRVTNPEPVGDQPETVENRVERSVDGGQTWETVADSVPVSASLTDYECLSFGETLYRVTATSALPSTAVTVQTLTTASNGVWVSFGRGYTRPFKLSRKARIQASSGLTYQQGYTFQGRTRPVFYDSKPQARTLQISAITLPQRTGESALECTEGVMRALDAMATTTGSKLLRDYTGRRVYGRVTSAQVTTNEAGVGEVSLQFTEGD